MKTTRWNHTGWLQHKSVTSSTPEAVSFLIIWICCASMCAGASRAEQQTIELGNGIRAVQRDRDPNLVSLGEATFNRLFEISLISAQGEQRTHAVTAARLVARNAQGDRNHRTMIEAGIQRSATQDELTFQDMGKLIFSPDGILRGQLRNNSQETWNYGAYVELEAVVFDLSALIVDQRMIEELALPENRFKPQGQVPETANAVSDAFFFYEEWSPDWRELPKPENGQGRRAHFAVRRWFSLLVLPKEFPYDPKELPLKAYCPLSVEGAVNTPMTEIISVMGGLEPYECRVVGLPPGLEWNQENLAISGIARRAGSYSATIEVKDAQFPPGAWDQARDARTTLGTPYQQLATTITIREPLAAELWLPLYSRKGNEVSAVCLCKGGAGRATFEAVRLPPGMQIDKESGRIYGRPTQVGSYQVEVRVMSPVTAEGSAPTVTAKGTWRIIEPLPAPAIR